MAVHADIDKHVKVYILVFVSLMLLTLVTVGVSYLDLAVPVAIGLALLVALVKGSLVACYFMHLIDEKRLIFVVMGFSVFFFFAVLLLPTMTQSNSFGTEEGGADVAAQHESHAEADPQGVDAAAEGALIVSLKAFHVVFVTLCAMLAVVVGSWALDQHSMVGGALYLAFAATSFLAAGGFLVYGAWFRRKLADVSYL